MHRVVAVTKNFRRRISGKGQRDSGPWRQGNMLIGIDLGTTNSAVAIWRDGAAELVPNALGNVLTPSAVSIAKGGESFVGAAALDRMATHPSDTATSFKRFMGTDRTTKLGGQDLS